MTTEEWYTLRIGSIVGNVNGKNPRIVLSVGNYLHTIQLLSKSKSKRCKIDGIAVYNRGDKPHFKLLKW